MKKQSASLIAKLLNKNSQPQGNPAAAIVQDEIVLRDAHEMVPNPKNKDYSMDNIEELAAMIQITHRIDPITVRELPDGRFMVISGHRRRLAQLYRYEHDMTDTADLPTVVQPMVNDFTEADITNDEIETLNVVFPNKGSRRNLTPSEEAAEIAMIKPIIRKLYDYQKAQNGAQGKFKEFFADVLGISATSLMRKEAINKLAEPVKAAVDAGEITSTAAAELSGLGEEEQSAVVASLQDKGEKVTVKAVSEAKEKLRRSESEEVKFTCPIETELEAAGQEKLLKTSVVDALAGKQEIQPDARSVERNEVTEQGIVMESEVFQHVQAITAYCRRQQHVDSSCNRCSCSRDGQCQIGRPCDWSVSVEGQDDEKEIQQ